MKNILLTILLTVMASFSFAQIGSKIASDRLPELEASWKDSISVLPWQNAGCLERIEDNGGLVIDVTK